MAFVQLPPFSFFKKKEKEKEISVKGTWEGVSFSTDAKTACSGSLEAHIYNGTYLTL